MATEETVDYDGQEICGCKEDYRAHFAANHRVCKWDKPNPVVSYWIDFAKLGGLDSRQINKAFFLAFDAWEKVCNIKFVPADSQNTAHLYFKTMRGDGRGGVLADNQLPCGPDRQLEGRYDRGEIWTLSENPPRGMIDLVRVACHEIGHAIGIFHHDPDPNNPALMDPAYNVNIRFPQERDIKVAQSLYGPPVNQPDPGDDPDPEPPPAGKTKVTITIEGDVDVQVTREAA